MEFPVSVKLDLSGLSKDHVMSWGDEIRFRDNTMVDDIAKLDDVELQTTEYESEATLDTSINTEGATESQLWMFAEISELVESNFETLVEKNLDYGTAFLNGAVREHVGSESPFDDSLDTALYRLFTRVGDKRERFQQQVIGEGSDRVNEDAVETALDAANYWLLIAWTLEHGEEHINMILEDLEEKKEVIDEASDEEVREYQEGTGISYV